MNTTVEKIAQAVCKEWGITPYHIIDKKRHNMDAKHTFRMELYRSGINSKQIARILDIDHSTAFASIRKYNELIRYCPAYRKKAERVFDDVNTNIAL